MFIVQVAADIFGNKLNLELTFPSRPSILELNKSTEAAFSNVIALRKPENVPAHAFHIAKVKIYDEDKNKWVDLLGEGQLVDYCQVYAFQPENPWHKESQKEIPPAIKPPLASGTTAVTRYTGANPTTPESRALATTNALGPYVGARTPADAVSEPSSSRWPFAGGNSAANTSIALVPKVSVDASHEEKLRVVFAEFDTKGVRMIDIEDFKQGFRGMGLDFSSATIEDLFERADLNRDNRISYSEFERFARLYPIMMDCLFFRSKAFWDEEQLRKEIQAEREAVEKAEQSLLSAQRALEAAEGDVSLAVQSVKAAEDDLRDRTDRMRTLARDMEDARKAREHAVREKKEREADLQVAKGREVEARKTLQDVAREADKLDRRASALTNDAVAADDKVRQLQLALEEAKRAADRAHQAAEQAAAESEQAKEREKSIALDVDTAAREIPRSEEVVRMAERNVAGAEQALKELDNIGKEIGREADEAARRRDASERAVLDAKDKVNHKARDLEAARIFVEDRERSATEKEAELDEHRRQRELVTQHERTLIEQELRLREQRDSLEQRETKLMSEASNFLGNMRTNLSGGRSYSRDPSAY